MKAQEKKKLQVTPHFFKKIFAACSIKKSKKFEEVCAYLKKGYNHDIMAELRRYDTISVRIVQRNFLE